jgi:acetaldehyde dehydrogenase (acetylating)
MTLGCGAAGGNITSDNISPLHLINLRRVAKETKPVDGRRSMAEAASGQSSAPSCSCPVMASVPTQADVAPPIAKAPEPTIELGGGMKWAITRAVERFLAAKNIAVSDAAPAIVRSDATPKAGPSPETTIDPRAGSKGPSTSYKPKPRPADFVSEAEIRAAVRSKQKILVGPKTIVTPAARDLAAEYDVLVVVE